MSEYVIMKDTGSLVSWESWVEELESYQKRGETPPLVEYPPLKCKYCGALVPEDVLKGPAINVEVWASRHVKAHREAVRELAAKKLPWSAGLVPVEVSMLREPVKPGRVEEIERHQLSDGGFAMITRLGHKYTFTRGFPSFEEPPEVTMDLTLDQARKLLADTLRSDVLESEGSFLYHHSPISEHCERVLAEPPKCYSFSGIRSYVMCFAWKEMEDRKLSRLPIKEAWQQARRVCKME